MKAIYGSPFLDDEENEEKKAKAPDPFSDRFLKTRQIILTGEVNKELADEIVRQLLILDTEDDTKPIYMYIDSPGGDVDAGFAIFDMIRFVKAPVYLIGMGLIAAAATLILLAVPKEKRFGLPNSRYLIHQPLGGTKGQATDMRIHTEHIIRTRDRLNHILSENTGKSLEEIERDTERDNFLTAEQALEYGLIDHIYSKRDN